MVDGSLSDVVPSMINLLGLEPPSQMTGRSLIELFAGQSETDPAPLPGVRSLIRFTRSRSSVQRFRRRWIAVLLGSVLLLPASAVTAQDAAEKARELKELRTRIQSLQQKLLTNQRKKSNAEKRLHDVENQISETSRVLRRIGSELDAKRGQLQALQEKQRGQAGKLKRQREHLASEARTAYAMGRQQQVKLLLNQEQPSAIGRMLVYFRYFSRARWNGSRAMRASLEQLRAA